MSILRRQLRERILLSAVITFSHDFSGNSILSTSLVLSIRLICSTSVCWQSWTTSRWRSYSGSKYFATTQSGILSANVFVALCMLFEIKTFILSISTGTFGNKLILSLGTAFILGNTFKSKVDMCIASVCFLDCGRCFVWILW